MNFSTKVKANAKPTENLELIQAKIHPKLAELIRKESKKNNFTLRSFIETSIREYLASAELKNKQK